MEPVIPPIQDAAERARLEVAIDDCVRRFYAKGAEDPLLGPIFTAINGLEEHMGIVANFWSRTLLGTDRYQGQPFAAHITGWFMLGDKATGPTAKDIEAYMAKTGKPISIGVAAGTGRWQSYSGGVYNACKTGELDHMINIVGWDNEGAAFDSNGNLPPGKGVWILRNSWGKGWGESGYMRTKMTDAAGKRCNAVAEEAAAFDFPAE